MTVPSKAVPEQLLRYTFAALAALCGIALMLLAPLGTMGFVSQAFAGGAAIYLYLRRNWREWLAVAALACGYGVIYRFTGAPVKTAIGAEVCLPASFFGLASMVVLACRLSRENPEGQKDLLRTIGAIGLLPALCWGSAIAVLANIQCTPYTFDRVLYAFDESLGVDVVFAAGRIFSGHPDFRYLCGLVYNCLPITLALLLALQTKRRLPGSPDVRAVFVALGVSGFLLYQICPAAGPIYLIGQAFPYHHVPVSSFALGPAPMGPFARNAMPSLHVGWSILVVYNSWFRARWVRAYALIALALTAVATLGLGEHYFIDLVVVFPLVAAVQLGCSGWRKNLPRILVSSGLTLAWLIACRTGIVLWHARPLSSWMLVAATLIMPGAFLLQALGADRGAIAGRAHPQEVPRPFRHP
ncbi:MAG: phosphatase PAP2 family protein [Bryobacteraceae bacterium]